VAYCHGAGDRTALASTQPIKGVIMDIITPLVDHHRTLRQRYQASEKDPSQFAEFTRHLVVHPTMEEKYFYELLQKIKRYFPESFTFRILDAAGVIHFTAQ
jgi:hypothetical protein